MAANNIISTNVRQSIDDFDGIKKAIVSKGVDMSGIIPTRDYAEKILSIPTTGEAGEVEEVPVWEAPSDWWDIKKMVNDGVLEWDTNDGILAGTPIENIRYGMVFSDAQDTVALPAGYTYYLSDGSVYTTTFVTIHTWDRSKDRYCATRDYKIRAIIVVNTSGNVVIYSNGVYYLTAQPINTLYVYCGNCVITSLTFGSSVIAQYNQVIEAFDCNDLTTATSTTVGTFYYCFSLVYCKLPKMTTLLNNYFRNCYKLRKVVLPSNLVGMATYVFTNCYNLHKIEFNSTITTLGLNCFEGCYALPQEVFKTILSVFNITLIPGYCFRYNYSIKEINIPEGITIINGYAFNNCSSCETLTLPASLTLIESTTAVQYLNALRIVNLPQGFNVANLYLVHSYSLSLESVRQWPTKLKDLTGETSKTITISSYVYNQMTADDKAAFTNINWTLASA